MYYGKLGGQGSMNGNKEDYAKEEHGNSPDVASCEKGGLRTENNERRGGKTNFCQPKDFPMEEHLCKMKSR